ncbi:ABC-type proline/glycine betaine transport system substrate-binding protein [Pantoea agglomerans]|uniref:hypothetical protein n=1 Tax=Enterobacter agglomerans TaxID=549 RepID=UPI0015FB980F|nr:hypothetical protein [Pantoea agglomerans]MBA8863364.1 ABC-type proline/glycine betaine transport system substrate-binding protein [Pantoea agglomerans]MBA8890351.1 ABC-type proline/glycine betaine transport system substrate-binding protein [Pantoea agglomerans]
MKRAHVLAVAFLAGLVCGCAVPAHAAKNSYSVTEYCTGVATVYDFSAQLQENLFKACIWGAEDGSKGDTVTRAAVNKDFHLNTPKNTATVSINRAYNLGFKQGSRK